MSLRQPGGPKTIHRRFEFDSYAGTREFLDRLAELSERCGFYPDIDFGTTYVRVSIEAAGQELLAEEGPAFVAEMEHLAQQG